MQVSNSLTAISVKNPCALSVGSYDGVHRGHQKIFTRMRELVGRKGIVAVITFKNHPTHVLPGRDPVKLIMPPEEKVARLEKCGVDVVFLLEFTLALASLSYEDFLDRALECCPFEYLVLGEGASLGKKRRGTPECLLRHGKEHGYAVEFVEKLKEEGEIISSGAIRQLLLEKNFEKAASFLGHLPME